MDIGANDVANAQDTSTNTEKGALWFAVQTISGKESIARINLERQSFQTWCPSIVKTVRSGRRTKRSVKALFPGYVFVFIDPDRQRWRSIDGTMGVVRLVKTGNRPAPLPQGFVEALQSDSDAYGIVSFREDFETGDNARVVTGAFDDWIGTVVDLPERDRVTLLLDMIGRRVRVTVPRSEIVRAA